MIARIAMIGWVSGVLFGCVIEDRLPLHAVDAGETADSGNTMPFVLALEAESFTANIPSSSCAFEVVSDAAASGGAFVWTPETCASSYAGPGARLVYEFSIAHAGSFRVLFRTLAADAESDSFAIGFDDEEFDPWSIPRSSTWMWQRYGAMRPFAPGLHRLHVAQRESGTMLDAIVITSSASYVPK